MTNLGYYKVIVAPTDTGYFTKYKSDVYIEYKCFPNSFSNREVGYIVTYFLQQVTFQNYIKIKIKLNGFDRNYREDHIYIIFFFVWNKPEKLKNQEWLTSKSLNVIGASIINSEKLIIWKWKKLPKYLKIQGKC